MKSILFTAVAMLFALGVTAQPRPQSQSKSPQPQAQRHDPKAEIRREVEKMYRGAKIEEIETTKTGYKAEIRLGRQEMDIYFDKSAKWTQTRYDVRLSDVPERVMNGIKNSKYSIYKIDDVVYIETPARTVYQVEFDRIFQDDKKVLFTPTGRML